jgi:hypothetical protein
VKPQTTDITKIVLSGQALAPGHLSLMTIKAWGACSPVDCAWTEVPFFLLDRFDSPNNYRRGFAAWEYEDGRRTYLLITFEKPGLRVDEVIFRGGRTSTPFSVVDRMTRIQ